VYLRNLSHQYTALDLNGKTRWREKNDKTKKSDIIHRELIMKAVDIYTSGTYIMYNIVDGP